MEKLVRKFKTKEALLMVFLLFETTAGYILKNLTCGLYDAEFSVILYNKRLTLTVVKTLNTVDTRRCVTGCTTHSTCRSVNYHRQNQVNEMLNATINCGVNNTGALRSDLIEENGWNHFDTRMKAEVFYLIFKLMPMIET